MDVPTLGAAMDAPPLGAAPVLGKPPPLGDVLSKIAEIASETLELQEVFDRVASAVREIIPFENMGVVRLLADDRAILHASTIPCQSKAAACVGPLPLTHWSPRMRPRPGPNPRINDALVELDPSFPVDGQVLAGGVRSGVWEPFRSSQSTRGGIWLAAYTPYAFTDEHQAYLRPIAALLGSAVEHWRIWDTERRRRQRLDQVDAVLGTLAESLDVREVFERLSEGMQPVLIHDLMVMTELDLRARTIRIAAHAGSADGPIPTQTVQLTDGELAQRADFEILHDIPAELAPDTERGRLILSAGMRSWLRVPVWLSGEISGSIGFFHREPNRFDLEDAEVARRLADRIGLTLSLKRLSEEARRAAESRERAERLEATVETLAREVASRGRGRVVGDSLAWKSALLDVARVAGSETTVLVTGESGTGKEVISSLVHQGSSRSNKPFVAINCAALSEQLLESELFGHEKGAFTGAIATKVGRIEQAAGGTLFLDEITEMSPQIQAKFLRVLQEREFQRLGGTRTLRADVRVIAATNRDLAAAMARETFREDLYYRLNVFQIHIPPLRERREDILPLAEAFLEDLGKRMGRPAAGISRDGRDWLLQYPWPGNVRELRNAIERAILLCDGGLITRDHLPAPMTRTAPPVVAPPSAAPASPSTNGHSDSAPVPFPETLDVTAMEQGLVTRALEQAKGNKSKAARLLGLTRAQLYTRLEKYRLS